MDRIVALHSNLMARLTEYCAPNPRRMAPRSLAFTSVFVVIVIILLFPVFRVHEIYKPQTPRLASDIAPVVAAQDTLDYLINFPLAPTEFGEMGQRVQLLYHRLDMVEQGQAGLTPSQAAALSDKLDKAVVATFPFINGASSSSTKAAFQALRSSYIKGSRGIVISLGKKDFRYACHLIANVRNVLRSGLPIQIAYAGDSDLPLAYREKLISLGNNIETLDLLKLVDDATLDLAHGTFGTKPLAMLVSSFEEVILLDADAVFVQTPEVLFKSSGYKQTGTYFFHDRLLNKGIFKERHDWWEKEMRHNPPSATLLKSLVYTEKYSAEQDSGVVVIDKSRTPVLLALLHICWQNSAAGREYMQGKVFGDKETYWFGFELSGVPYYFEKHYGNGLGPVSDSKVVCGNAIAHADEADRLLWFNGGLLANKYQDKKKFGDFSHWMLDGHWLPQTGGDGVSCEDQGNIMTVDERDRKVLSGSIKEAKLTDEQFKDFIGS